jgi:hypothetical protein
LIASIEANHDEDAIVAAAAKAVRERIANAKPKRKIRCKT